MLSLVGVRVTYALYTQLGSTGNYSATAISTNFTVLRYTRTRILSLRFSYPGNGFITVSLSLQITYEFFLSRPNSFLAIILQLPTQFSSSIPKLTSCQAGVSKLHTSLNGHNWTPVCNHFARTTQKTQPLCCWKACLQRRYIATDVSCVLHIRCLGNGFTELLPSNELLFWLYYSRFRPSCHNIYI
jgi:hypothetical protein